MPLRQSGHQRRGGAGLRPLQYRPPRLAWPHWRGASISITAATATQGIAQATKASRQLSPTSGSTIGSVSATGMISPISSPFV